VNITRDLIEARLADLRAGLVQLQANLQATQGAVQECEHWLGVLAQDGVLAPPEAQPLFRALEARPGTMDKEPVE
jgi:hypothetical protein